MEKILMRISGSRFFLALLSWINQIPFPFKKIPVRVYGNRMVAHTFDRFAALIFWRQGWLESAEHNLICQFARPGMNLVDAGANIGVHTLQMSRLVGPDGRVWAFEPNSNNGCTLQQNLSQNGCQNVIVEQAALSCKTEPILFYSSKTNQGDHSIYASGEGFQDINSVQAYALDDYFPANQKIDFIKMDIQGAEGLALAGMRRLCNANPEIILLMEFYPSGIQKAGCSPEQVLKDLREDGFTILLVDEKKNGLSEVKDFEEFVRSFTGKSYCNLLIRREVQPLNLPS